MACALNERLCCAQRRADRADSAGRCTIAARHHGRHVEVCKHPCLYAAQPRRQPCPGWTPMASAFISSSADKGHRSCCCTRWAARSTAGTDFSRPEQALPHAALRPARLRAVGKGAPADHHRNPGGRPRGRAAGERPPAALSFRHRRRRHHAGADLHDQASRSRCELRVLQSVHRRRSDPGGRARTARGSRRSARACARPFPPRSTSRGRPISATPRPMRPIAAATWRTIRSASPP